MNGNHHHDSTTSQGINGINSGESEAMEGMEEDGMDLEPTLDTHHLLTSLFGSFEQAAGQFSHCNARAQLLGEF